ncbi:FMN reductase [Schumannella luteola]|jgi:FMN reductase
MTKSIRIVGVSGSLGVPSRTTALIRAAADEFAVPLNAEVEVIELGSLVSDLAASSRSALGPAAQAALAAVESADVLVVGSPAYRATYTGIFKHFFDFVGQYALVDKPIVLTATGGSDRHALLVEHQMRPLFGFFQALTLPLGIFATETDFENYVITSDDLRERIQLSVRRTIGLLASQLAITEAPVERSLHPSSF